MKGSPCAMNVVVWATIKPTISQEASRLRTKRSQRTEKSEMALGPMIAGIEEDGYNPTFPRSCPRSHGLKPKRRVAKIASRKGETTKSNSRSTVRYLKCANQRSNSHLSGRRYFTIKGLYKWREEAMKGLPGPLSNYKTKSSRIRRDVANGETCKPLRIEDGSNGIHQDSNQQFLPNEDTPIEC
ncbi:hypothetical protein ACH5RR_036598 [Cinchona calisaya]|uniref:Uncharacterized protein n=1 Tax=Cinchona calisaya TaxID=153742 RepID=A0ABD2Y7A5_9GENT